MFCIIMIINPFRTAVYYQADLARKHVTEAIHVASAQQSNETSTATEYCY